MNNRLTEIARRIQNGKGFVDVGTDHGYLPVFMAQQGYTGAIIASDINAAPLSCARENASSAGLEDRITFLQCDGVDESLRTVVDTIVVAGMGGDTICGILDRAEWCMDAAYDLILQPMTKPEILRYWLCCNDFEITQEVLAEDNGTLYQIICCHYGKRQVLSDSELFVGKLSCVRTEPLFPRHLSDTLHRFRRMIVGMEQSQDDRERHKLEFTQEIYRQLSDMKDSICGGHSL